jgi:VWFA-related protein
MKTGSARASLLAFTLIAQGFAPPRALARASAQTPTQAQQPPAARPLPPPPPTPAAPADDDEVVRVNVNLVQLDAVVTDRDGRQVTNLRPEDFEIFEDERPQQITHFAYVSADPTAPASSNSNASAPAPTERLTPPAVLKPLRPSEVRRTIALVFDDLNTSFESVPPLRAALRKYVEEQVGPGDLVAVIRTGGDAGALQQFTSDRRQLLAAVERMRWNPCSSRGIHITTPVPDTSNGLLPPPIGGLCGGRPVQGTLGVLKFILGGMRELAGRKSLVVFSDSLTIEVKEGDDGTISPVSSSDEDGDSTDGGTSYAYLYQRIAAAAIRASVVIYGVDTRGLPALMPSAIDHTSGMNGQAISALISSREREMMAGREGQSLLASQTGGFVIYNTNDLNLGLRRIAEDLKGYYLIGYRPAAQTFDRRFHKFGVRLKNHPGLSVRTRRGFYGVSEEESRPPARSPEDRLRLALMSPFGAGDIPLRVTALFGDAPPAGSFVRALVHLEARSLTFEDAPDGWHKAVIDVGGVAFGDNGRIVTERRRTNTLSLRGKTYEHALRDGIDFALDLPLKKPGAYQVRVAVRDSATTRPRRGGPVRRSPRARRRAARALRHRRERQSRRRERKPERAAARADRRRLERAGRRGRRAGEPRRQTLSPPFVAQLRLRRLQRAARQTERAAAPHRPRPPHARRQRSLRLRGRAARRRRAERSHAPTRRREPPPRRGTPARRLPPPDRRHGPTRRPQTPHRRAVDRFRDYQMTANRKS